MKITHRTIAGADSSTDPQANYPPERGINPINLTFRKNLIETRPPFFEYTLYFENKKDEEIFRKGNVTGSIFYRGVFPFSRAGVMVSIYTHLFYGELKGKSISFKKIGTIEHPLIQYNFFCQAEENVLITNGKSYPLGWTGVGAAIKAKDFPIVEDTPVMVDAIFSCFCHGRIFVGTKGGLVYASDHFYADGIDKSKRQAVFRFKESTYPEAGDGFSAPSELGTLTGISFFTRSSQLNGAGEVIVAGSNGFYTIDPTPVRNEWTRMAMQKTLYSGNGASSHLSLTKVGSDIWYTDSLNGVSSIGMSTSELDSEIGISFLGKEVENLFAYDRSSEKCLPMSLYHKGRIFFSVAHDSAAGGIDPKAVNRYGNGFAVMDLYRGSTLRRDSVNWDGLWTGLRPTSLCNGFSEGASVAFIFSLAKDGTNKVFGIGDSGHDSFHLNGKQEDSLIKSSITLPFPLPREEIETYKTKISLTGFKEAYPGTVISSHISTPKGEIKMGEVTIDGCNGKEDCSPLSFISGLKTGILKGFEPCSQKSFDNVSANIKITGRAIISYHQVEIDESGVPDKCELIDQELNCSDNFNYLL